MTRGYMPALTLIVFGIGLGIGQSWIRGLIPVSLTPAKTGTLSPELTKHDSLPPPSDRLVESQAANSVSMTEEADLIENQKEPEQVEAAEIATSSPIEFAENDLRKRDRPRSAPPLRRRSEPKAEVTNEEISLGNSAQVIQIGKRRQRAIPLNKQADFRNESTTDQSQTVVAAAHQDPGETGDDTTNLKNTNPSPRDQLSEAQEKLSKGETLAAHRDLSSIYWNHKDFRPRIQSLIDETAKTIFFQPKPHFIDPHVIQEGERLEVIAKKYQLSWEFLAKLNRTNPKRIQVGQKLKMLKGPFGAVVELDDFLLTVHLGSYYVKNYQVGIGRDGSSPKGKRTVLNKVVDPDYTDDRTGKVIKGDDPANPLGERWIDLGDSYGIHGTIDPDSIGKAESRGCIRMRDDDIVEVYDFLVKGSQVVLR